ncbi:MAG: phage holin family protein [Bacteroidota bacterium]
MTATEFFYKAAATLITPFRYAEKGVQNLKENLKEDLEVIIANLLKLAILAGLAFLFLLFISITAAIVLNRALQSDYLGYAILAGFYLIVAVILYANREMSDVKKKAINKPKIAEH